MALAPRARPARYLEPRDTYDEENFLTRGQDAVYEVDESRTVKVELEAGQVLSFT